MVPSIRDLLVRPDAYFSDLVKSEVSLKVPLLIILAGAIIGAISAYQVSSLTGQMFSQAMPGMGGIVLIMGALGGFVIFFIIWAIYSGILHIISMAFKGKGPFRRTLQITGLGLLPQVFGSVITLLLALYYLPQVQIPRVTSFQDPQLLQAAIQQLMNDPAMRQFSLISTVIGILFLLWSANIWIFGVRHGRSITLKHAIITVIIPIAAYIIYVVIMQIIGISAMGGL